jgi:hypothetical protein
MVRVVGNAGLGNNAGPIVRGASERDILLD